MIRTSQYVTELSTGIGASWNRFWFTPADALPLGVLRIGTGLLGLYFLGSHTADLARWFGPHGLLPVETVREIASGMGRQTIWRLSYLNYYTDVPALLWTLHALGIVVLLAMTLGLLTRVSTVLSLVVVLSYIHRAPMITGQLEPILTMLLCYLCLGPAGRCLSLDRLLFGGKSTPRDPSGDNSWLANLSLRLIQVHVVGFYFMMGLTKLAGATWWEGTAVWAIVVSHPDSQIVDLTFLRRVPYLIDILTHLIVFFEIMFGLFIWNRLARPLLLMLAIPMWLMLAVLTANFALCGAMLIANLAFVPADFWRELLDRDTRSLSAHTARG